MERCPRIYWIEKDKRCVWASLQVPRYSGTPLPASSSIPNRADGADSAQDAKALSTAIKDRRKDRAAKYSVPLPKVRGIAEEEMFKVIKTGQHKGKSWKRMVNKATFVGEGFTRKPVKLERFIRPMGLVSIVLGRKRRKLSLMQRMTKANVTHRELRDGRMWCD